MITSILGTDQVGASRTTINSNFNILASSVLGLQTNPSNQYITNYISGNLSYQYTIGTWFNLISSNDVSLIASGASFIFKVGPINSFSEGGNIYNETAVFLAELWGGTNDTNATPIYATYAGTATNGKTISFQLLRTMNAGDGKSYIQMKVDETLTSPITINWQALRIF
jgi:hypothetical protein